MTTLQTGVLAYGPHAIETEVWDENAEPLGPWEVIYTLYQ